MDFIEDLLTPKEEFTPIPFWFINDDLQPNVLKSQLEDFKEKGVNGVVVHPRIGIPKEISYLSNKYFDIIKYIVKVADDLDIKIVLYDEGMYPSGSANGQVVKANPDFASLGLSLVSDLSNVEKSKIIFAFDDGKYLVEQKTGGTIRGIHFGEDDGEPNAPLSADILNSEATQKFMELVYDQHYNHLKEYFGNTIIGIFTDEPDPKGRNAGGMFDWTTGMEKEILAAGGNLADLRSLFEGKENHSTNIYRKIVTNQLNNVYYKAISNWCQQRGIMLMGHPASSDDIDEQIHFHVPGQDLIFRRMSPEHGGIYGMDSVQGKCSSDAARHFGRRRNSNECFGVCVKDNIPWYFTGQDMKWYIDWLGVRGVNLFIPHAFYYSIRDERKNERPPDVGPNNIWWQYYKYFSDYIKCVSYVMTDSINLTDIAILCESKKVPHKELIPLYENQIEFNYLPKSLLKKEWKQGEKIKINDYEYTNIFDVDSKNFEQDILDFVKIAKKDFKTADFCAGLRVTQLRKNNVDMYFIFNENNDNIKTNVTIPQQGDPVCIDLWKKQFHKTNVIDYSNGTTFELDLKAYETMLIVILSKGSAKDIPHKPNATFIGNLTNQFKLISENKNNFTKTYIANQDIVKVKGYEEFEVIGEEMAECWCNNNFVGVSFASPHRFEIGKFLEVGKNQLKIVLTGNAANKYGGVDIFYGF